MNLPLVTKKIRIEGRVQGVWYRGWTVDQATSRGLSGWVRNRSDGSVEAIVSGRDLIVNEMVGLCWHGPLAARVSAVTEQTIKTAIFDGFKQRSTQ